MKARQQSIRTQGRTDFVDITGMVKEFVAEEGISDGVCFVYVPHTTAGVTINENADPSVPEDVIGVLERLVPWEAGYRHTEGNSAAHVKASLMGSSVAIPVDNGRLMLGTWQGVFFCDFDGPRTRKVILKVTSGE